MTTIVDDELTFSIGWCLWSRLNVLLALLTSLRGPHEHRDAGEQFTLGAVEQSSLGIASALLHLLRNVGNMVGVAVATAIRRAPNSWSRRLRND